MATENTESSYTNKNWKAAKHRAKCYGKKVDVLWSVQFGSLWSVACAVKITTFHFGQ